MKYIFVILVFLFTSEYVDASILDALKDNDGNYKPLSKIFKDEDGNTNWQYIANFTGSVLILLLSFSLLSLTISQIKLRSRNDELREIKKNLESTVAKRTENLKISNELLEAEITEHKQTSAQLLSSQNYLQSILASMPSMLIGLNKAYEITHWNNTAEAVTGLSQDDVLNKNLWEAYPAITISPEQIQSVISLGKFKEIKHNQRGQYYFNITIYPLAEDQSGVVLVIENTTQRSIAERVLIQRDKMASMGELASNMAHDIDIPLQAMLSNLQEIGTLLDKKSSAIEELLRETTSRGQQASAVVNNLLVFSRNRTTDKQQASLTEILDHCIELSNYVLSEGDKLHFRDVEVKLHYEQDLPDIHCYPAELQQVFISLFRHACTAMANKSEQEYVPTITIEVMNAYDSVWVKVQHNGVGLSAEEQMDIFEPLVQQSIDSDKSLTPENRLSFSYFIVTEHHEGQMAITSDPAVGTTFHMQFLNE